MEVDERGGTIFRYCTKVSLMVTASQRKISLALDAGMLDSAKRLAINVSAIAEAALQRAVTESRRRQWLDESSHVFVAQAAWHERNGHPLAEIMTSPFGSLWKN